MSIRIEGLSKAFGGHEVLKGLNTQFAAGQITCVMGPSGCGKTTLLNLIMGLVPADKGEILFDSGNRIAAVFQEDRLCKNLNAVSNVAMVLGKQFSIAEIHRHLQMVGLEEESSMLPVSQLSGGMKRRVALVRAVMADSDILIMDEPFKGLDEQNRILAAEYIKKHLHTRVGIVVTHDMQDVALLGATAIDFAELQRKS